MPPKPIHLVSIKDNEDGDWKKYLHFKSTYNKLQCYKTVLNAFDNKRRYLNNIGSEPWP